MRLTASALLLATALLVSLASETSAQVLVSENLGEEAYSASGTHRVFTPDRAFDGEARHNYRYWNAAGHPPQWIEVDLQGVYSLSEILLVVAQYPDGETTHEVWISDQPIGEDTFNATRTHVIEGLTIDRQVLKAEFTESRTARYVQIRTVRSPSWVAWMEVQVYAEVAS